MSSEYSLFTSLTLVQTNLYKFVGPILIGVGTVSCILNLVVFTRKNLRKNPCSMYLVAYNISNLLVIYTAILFSTLSYGYNIDLTAYNLHFCRFRFYALFLLDILSPCYLIAASVDRILITSRNARTRQRSSRRLAYICIIIITLFWLLFHIHALFQAELIQLAPSYFTCYLQSGSYLTFISYYVVIQVILVLLLMTISGLWAVKNVRRLGHAAPASTIVTVGPTTTIQRVHAGPSKDRQLLQILLIDIGFYIFFNLMIMGVLMYQQFTQDPSDSLVKTQIYVLLQSIGTFSPYIPFCVGCYTNLLASKTFRHEVKNILMCK